MSNNVKCVFQCTKKPEGDSGEIVLEPRYSDAQGNKFLHDFAKYTPSGRMSFYCDNPSATAAFEVGAYYDIVLSRRETPAVEPAPTV